MIRVIQAGLYTNIQDLGRFGFQKFGVTSAGAMDTESHILANWLAGNPSETATIEMTLIGATFEFIKDAVIGITGADFSPTLNATPINNYETITVKKGDILQFKNTKNACRCYLAVQGKWQLFPVMNSVATHTSSKIGGLNGAILKKGDWITIENKNINQTFKKVPQTLQITYTKALTVRVTKGLEFNSFTKDSIDSFLKTSYQISPQSNRMGYRMIGDILQTKTNISLISSGIITGTIQVPTNGQPIILLNDKQTVGGYPRIANIISHDLAFLAQQKPGDRIRFKLVSLEEAHKLIETRNKLIQSLALL